MLGRLRPEDAVGVNTNDIYYADGLGPAARFLRGYLDGGGSSGLGREDTVSPAAADAETTETTALRFGLINIESR